MTSSSSAISRLAPLSSRSGQGPALPPDRSQIEASRSQRSSPLRRWSNWESRGWEVGFDSSWAASRTGPPFEQVQLVVACNAWHWIEPGVGVQLVAELLPPGGTLALVWT